jgi:hypothetical protein
MRGERCCIRSSNTLLGRSGSQGAEGGRSVSKSGFVASAIRELSVGMCCGTFQMYRLGLELLAGVAARRYRQGIAVPTEDLRA